MILYIIAFEHCFFFVNVTHHNPRAFVIIGFPTRYFFMTMDYEDYLKKWLFQEKGWKIIRDTKKMHVLNCTFIIDDELLDSMRRIA